MAGWGTAARGRPSAAPMSAPDDEGVDEDLLAEPQLPLELADPVRFREAEVVYATEAADYSFVVLDRGGELRWPMVPVVRSGDLLIVAWPAAAGPQFGGPT